MPTEKIPQTFKVTPPKKRNNFTLITLFRKTAYREMFPMFIHLSGATNLLQLKIQKLKHISKSKLNIFCPAKLNTLAWKDLKGNRAEASGLCAMDSGQLHLSVCLHLKYSHQLHLKVNYFLLYYLLISSLV